MSLHDLRHRGEYSVFDREEIIYEAYERMTDGGLGFLTLEDVTKVVEHHPWMSYWGGRTWYVPESAVVTR